MAYPLPRNGWTVTTHHPVVWDLQTERLQRGSIPGGRFFIFRIVLAGTEANAGKKREMPYEALSYPGCLGQNPEVFEKLKNTAVLIRWSATRPAFWWRKNGLSRKY